MGKRRNEKEVSWTEWKENFIIIKFWGYHQGSIYRKIIIHDYIRKKKVSNQWLKLSSYVDTSQNQLNGNRKG